MMNSLVKSIYYTLYNFLINSIAGLIKKAPFKNAWQIFEVARQRLEQVDEVFITYHQRPKQLHAIQSPVYQMPQNSKVVIVMQGPLLLEHDFTFQTAKYYQQSMPNAFIIVSTWDDQDPATIKRLKTLDNVRVLESPLPSYNGPLNINYQLVGTQEGIALAKELGATHILKTRCDQRIYQNNADGILLSLLTTFPLDRVVNQVLKERIIACSFTSLKFRPYGIGDMLVFGTAKDMELYWNAPLDHRKLDIEAIRQLSVVDYAKTALAETYICASFLNRIGIELDWTIQQTWQMYQDYFTVVDAETVDLFWPKYAREKEYRFKYYNQLNAFELLKLSDWMMMRSGNLVLDQALEEQILQTKEGHKVGG